MTSKERSLIGKLSSKGLWMGWKEEEMRTCLCISFSGSYLSGFLPDALPRD